MEGLGAERPMGAAAAYGGNRFKGRARVSGERTIGAARFRPQYIQPPPPPPPPVDQVHLDAPGQRHRQQPVSRTADPQSSQTGQVIRGLR